MADVGNISIHAFFGRFRSCVNLKIHLTISVFPLLARKNRQKKTPEENTLSSFTDLVSTYPRNRPHQVLQPEALGQAIPGTFPRLRQVSFSVLVLVLLAASTGSSQSSIFSSYLNQEVKPLKSGGFFVVIPLAAVHWSG